MRCISSITFKGKREKQISNHKVVVQFNSEKETKSISGLDKNRSICMHCEHDGTIDHRKENLTEKTVQNDACNLHTTSRAIL